MSLTRRQKSNLWVLFGVSVLIMFFAGIGYLINWSDETSSVTHYCSGGTGITISQFNDGTQSTSVTFDDLKCK